MSVFPPFLQKKQIDEAWPMRIGKPRDGLFEIGLALGGTVSAGAYTAGVLDFLLEALDAWQKEKDGPGRQNVPRHDVAIRVIAGASGGAINGILFSRIAEYASDRGPVPSNPLFSTWTQVLVHDLLSTKGQDQFNSFLNATKIRKVADAAIEYEGRPGPKRPFLTNPLRVFTTVTNLTGLPYRVSMGGEAGLAHSMSNMADWVHMLAEVSGGDPDPLRAFITHDAASLTRGKVWETARDAALATSAFPGAFPARIIKRNALGPCYRFFYTSDDSGKSEVRQLAPDWALLAPGYKPEGEVESLNVDGGACNNEPIDIARRVLAGYGGRNPRDGNESCRATILIDPFSDTEGLGPNTAPENPYKPLLRLLSGLVSQARFKPEDVVLAQDDNVFSRFLIAPTGQGKVEHKSEDTRPTIGAKAIAAGAFGGFSGFLDPEFLAYDFRLGRRNAYSFLTKHFMLPESNPLFGDLWANPEKLGTWEDIETAPDGAKRTYRAVIPVMKSVKVPDDPGVLPRISDKKMDDIFDLADKRLEWLFERTKDVLLSKPGFGNSMARAYLNVGWWVKRGSLRDGIRKYMEKELRRRGLMGNQPRPRFESSPIGRGNNQ